MELDRLLERAVELGASDIHLKVGRVPIVRLDGSLTPLEEWPTLGDTEVENVLERVCASDPSRLDTFHATGDLDVAYKAERLPRFRVNGYRQRGATSFAFRMIPKHIPTFAELCLPPGVQRLAEERQGLILVTGPTGSGKSTTLAAMIDHINRTRRSHIVTVEDPIEYMHSDQSCVVNQREVGLDTESFKRALRQVLRQDPDIILIGELRDTESAETALQAAESGHLVLSTIHTIDAAETVSRMIEFFPGIKQAQVRSILAGVLRGVVSQQLLPRAGGGRVAAVEIMVTNARIAELILENHTDEITDAIEKGSFLQMQTSQQALIELVLSGQAERDVAANVARNRHDFLVALDHALKRQAAERAQADAATRPPPGLGLRVTESMHRA